MEYQAVVMAAGLGSRMREITSSIPKCLLPVGNVPLILCSLNILKRAGISEVIVLVQENERLKIQNAVENKIDLKLDFVSVLKDEDWGTADSLRYIKDKIKTDVIVVSCDLVTEFNLNNLIVLHRSQNSALTMLLVPFPKTLKEMDMPGCKKKCKFERDIIGLNSNGQVMFINSEADFEDGVPLKLSVLKQNPSMQVYCNLMDAHFYIIKKDLVDFIVSNEYISTIKGEFLPAAVKKQFSQKKQKHSDVIESSSAHAGVDYNCLDLKKLAMHMSSWRDPNSCGKPNLEEDIKCFAYVDRETLCSRVNTIVAYADINRKVSKYFTHITGMTPKVHPFPKSQVDIESILGDNCELLNKVSVRQSVIGNNCKLVEKVKISNSVVMENVQIGKDCVIQNSIICSNVTIEDVCCIKNCIIGPDQTVKSATKLNSEILQCTHQLMEI